LTTSKRRWMRRRSEVLSLRIPRWRFREKVRLLSISKEMWNTGCGNYDFRPDSAMLTDAFSSLRCACGAEKRERQSALRINEHG
jgi:hypothetical protein